VAATAAAAVAVATTAAAVRRTAAGRPSGGTIARRHQRTGGEDRPVDVCVRHSCGPVRAGSRLFFKGDVGPAESCRFSLAVARRLLSSDARRA
jgi:hypothetical protein